MKKMYVVLSSPLFLSGCMMLGMRGMARPGGSGMHGAARDSSMTGPTYVKEAVVDGIRITAEFPAYLLGDQLAYRVTVRNVGDKSPISNASLALIVTADRTRHEDSASVTAGSDSSHADSSTTPSPGTVERMVVAPDEIADGAYVFRPSITTGGAYRLVVVLARIGDVALTSPIEVEQTIQLRARQRPHSGTGGPATRASRTPTVLLGAGVMAVMMFFMIR